MKSVIYGKNWSYTQNKMLGLISFEEANEYFDNCKRFVIFFEEINVIVIIQDDKSINITYLKDGYEFSYKIIEDDPVINPKFYFLWRYSIYDKNIIKNINFLIFNYDNGGTHTLHEYGSIEKVIENDNNEKLKFSFSNLIDFFKINNQKSKFSFKYLIDNKKVDINSLYMEIPNFGEWDKILDKGVARVKYLNK